MTKTWTEELVYVQTEDDLVLAGAQFAPTERRKELAVLFSHGIGGSFSQPAYTHIARTLAGRGYFVVSGENRGHHFGYKAGELAPMEPRLEGAGWERFSEAPRDIAAWVNHLEQQGFSRIVLAGHSYGAYKSTYYLGKSADPRIVGLVLGSPPRGVANLAHPQLVALAEKMESEGRGRDLLPWGLFSWSATTVSARTYLDAYRLNIDFFGFDTPDPLIAQVRCPILAMYGTVEAQVGDQGELDKIARNATASPAVQTLILQGVDHSYEGSGGQIGQTIGDWLDALS